MKRDPKTGEYVVTFQHGTKTTPVYIKFRKDPSGYRDAWSCEYDVSVTTKGKYRFYDTYAGMQDTPGVEAVLKRASDMTAKAMRAEERDEAESDRVAAQLKDWKPGTSLKKNSGSKSKSSGLSARRLAAWMKGMPGKHDVQTATGFADPDHPTFYVAGCVVGSHVSSITVYPSKGGWDVSTVLSDARGNRLKQWNAHCTADEVKGQIAKACEATADADRQKLVSKKTRETIVGRT